MRFACRIAKVTSIYSEFVLHIAFHGRIGYVNAPGYYVIVEWKRNLVAHGDAREEKWRGKRRMEWVVKQASFWLGTVHPVLLQSFSPDPHYKKASTRLNWHPRRYKWTRPFRWKTESGFCACAITFHLHSTWSVFFCTIVSDAYYLYTVINNLRIAWHNPCKMTTQALSIKIDLLKPIGHVMHQQFNIQQLYALPTLYLCVLYLSENKQRLVPLTA